MTTRALAHQNSLICCAQPNADVRRAPAERYTDRGAPGCLIAGSCGEVYTHQTALVNQESCVLAETGAHDDRHRQDRLGEIDRAPTAICAGTGTSTPSPVRWRPTIGWSTRSDRRGARVRVVAIVANHQRGGDAVWPLLCRQGDHENSVRATTKGITRGLATSSSSRFLPPACKAAARPAGSGPPNHPNGARHCDLYLCYGWATRMPRRQPTGSLTVDERVSRKMWR